MEKELTSLYASMKTKYVTYFAMASEEKHFSECDKMADELKAIRTVLKILRRTK